MVSTSVDEIKNRLDIVDVIGDYIRLQKAGANFKAVCPFHHEKTPSFMVSSERQIWHCFGCGEGGDMFSFVMKIEGVEFKDALRSLAQRAGIRLQSEDPKIRSAKSVLFEIMDLATKFFEHQLSKSATGLKAKSYLKKRGLDDKTIKEFRLGYAPDSWHGLENFLKSKGYEEDDVIKSGLVVKNEDSNRCHDRFRNRITFPICNLSGEVVGFSGRIFEAGQAKGSKADMAKYINTPQTLIYDKSRILYGLDKSRVEIRKNKQAVLVEGNIDVVLSHRAGIKNVVASSGTALTLDQLKIIKRYSNNILMSFDADEAGEGATQKGIQLAVSQGFNVKVIDLPQGKDPADLVKENPARWKKSIGSAISVMEFYFQKAFSKFDSATAEGKRAIGDFLLPVLKKMVNRIEQAHWIQELSSKIRVDEKVLMEQMRSMKEIKERDFQDSSGKEQAVEKKSRLEKLEENFVSFMLQNPMLLKEIIDDLDDEFITTPSLAGLYGEAKDYFIESGFRAEKDICKKIPAVLADKANELLLKADYMSLSEDDTKAEFYYCFKSIKELKLKENLVELSNKIKTAESDGNKAKVMRLSKKFMEVSKELSNLKNT